MPSPKTRRYSIEIKDPDNKAVLFTAVNWTEEEWSAPRDRSQGES
jgi:hypothetical protein